MRREGWNRVGVEGLGWQKPELVLRKGSSKTILEIGKTNPNAAAGEGSELRDGRAGEGPESSKPVTQKSPWP